MGLPSMISQTDEQSLFWPLLPLYDVGTISYLFKEYVEVGWYQKEINHMHLPHPNERNNLAVAFGLYEDLSWKYLFILQNHVGNIWMECNKKSSEIWIGCCLLTQATCATLDILGLATSRRWRNRNLPGWCNEVRTLRGSSGGVCGGGGGILCTGFIIYVMSPSAERAGSSTKRWVCSKIVRCNKLDCFPWTQKTDYNAQ